MGPLRLKPVGISLALVIQEVGLRINCGEGPMSHSLRRPFGRGLGYFTFILFEFHAW